MKSQKLSKRSRTSIRLSYFIPLLLYGVVLGLSYPGADLWFFGHIALVPLTLLAVRGRRVGQMVLMSFLASFVWWLVMLYWLSSVTIPGYVVLCAYLAIFVPLYMLIHCLIRSHLPISLVFSVPIVWVGVEYLRSVLFTGFPWFSLGHTQPISMIQIADLSGVSGVSFVVAMTSGMICDVLTKPLMTTTGSVRRFGRSVAIAVIVWAMVITASIAYGTWRLGQYDSGKVHGDASLSVAVVQTDVPQSNKEAPTAEQDAEDFARGIVLSKAAMASSPQLIVWPETSVPEALNDDAYDVYRLSTTTQTLYREQVERFAREHNVFTLVGAPSYFAWTTTEDGLHQTPMQHCNSAYFFTPNGILADRYDKVHRVIFGEYIPLREALPWLVPVLQMFTPYDNDYSIEKGKSFTVFSLPRSKEAAGAVVSDGWRFSTPICFEDVVSGVCRQMSYDHGGKRIDMLVNITNDGWYPGSIEGVQHEQIARFRCVENRVPMVRSVNRGISSIIDSCGRITCRVEVDGQHQLVSGTVTGYVRSDRRWSVFGMIGESFGKTCLVLTMLLVIVSVTHRRLQQRR